MALLALTASADVLRGLPAVTDFYLSVVRSTAIDNGDGTWTVAAQADEGDTAKLEALGCTVAVTTSNADQLARWQAIDDQIDNEPATPPNT